MRADDASRACDDARGSIHHVDEHVNAVDCICLHVRDRGARHRECEHAHALSLHGHGNVHALRLLKVKYPKP